MSDWNDKIIKEFRDNNGVVGGPFAGAHLLLLTTVGAKSGDKRTSPMMYFPNGDTRIVVASKAGADTNPHWYHNLMKNSEVHVEASVEGGSDEYDAIASAMPWYIAWVSAFFFSGRAISMVATPLTIAALMLMGQVS